MYLSSTYYFTLVINKPLVHHEQAALVLFCVLHNGKDNGYKFTVYITLIYNKYIERLCDWFID